MTGLILAAAVAVTALSAVVGIPALWPLGVFLAGVALGLLGSGRR